MKMAINFFKGMLIGIVNIIPGVSGGTIAIVLGIFDDLIVAINNFYKSFADFKKHFNFLFPIVIGAVVGILAFSSLVASALEAYSFPTVMFFMGLVVGSIPLIYKKASAKGVKSTYFIATAIAMVFVILMAVLRNNEATTFPGTDTTATMVMMFFGGMISSAAMVIPGTSGSFVMLLLGIYYDIIHAVSSLRVYLQNPTDFEFLMEIMVVIIPLGLGIVLGILIISKVILVLLTRHYSITYFTILGLMIATVFAIFIDPITYQSGVDFISIVLGVGTFGVGFVTSYMLGRK